MLSTKQRAVLDYLAARPIMGAASTMELVRRADRCTRGHAAGYERVQRLERRGLVVRPGLAQHGTAPVLITAKGLALIGGAA